MAYKKQNFTDGQVLTAAHLNYIEDGLEELSGQNINLYIGADEPTGDNRPLYWLDTSDEETGDNAGGGDVQEPDNPEIMTYTITNTLTNVTNSNAATSVDENASYTATLTADEGYEISTVKVTIGGTDVTSTVYAGGVITISDVTGNVVITATATAAMSGTPVAMAEDYGSGTLTYYSGDENTEGKTISKQAKVSQKTFDVDTVVSYKFILSSTQYGTIFVGSRGDSGRVYYYAEGVPKKETYHTQGVEYTGTYTVRAGHRFAIFGQASNAVFETMEVVE